MPFSMLIPSAVALLETDSRQDGDRYDGPVSFPLEVNYDNDVLWCSGSSLTERELASIGSLGTATKAAIYSLETLQ